MPWKLWDEIIYPFPNLGIKINNFIPHNMCNYLFMLVLKLNHVTKRGPWTLLREYHSSAATRIGNRNFIHFVLSSQCFQTSPIYFFAQLSMSPYMVLSPYTFQLPFKSDQQGYTISVSGYKLVVWLHCYNYQSQDILCVFSRSKGWRNGSCSGFMQ